MPSASAAAAALVLLFLAFSLSNAQPGFISLDCGGDDDYTDGIGIQWTSDAKFVSAGQKANLLLQNQQLQQYTTVRSFPADNRKYCYTMNVRNRTRYLVRATFLYGNFDNSNVYPKFDLSLGPTPWTTVVIDDATTPVVQEAIILAAAPTLSVCLSNASTGQPFISTLELRQFNGSLYYTTDEKQFFLRLSARINFGAESNASVRYPDDPFDRIWESDLVRRANYLVDVAPGTERISTTKPIFVSTNEEPPQRVMQTAVVGKNGSLTYRIDLEDFPGNAWGVSYFAEIEDLAPSQTRKFKLVIPGKPEFSKPTVDVEENAQGKYRLYEPGYTNIPLPFVFSFGFKKTNDSSEGPILNAMEIYRYIEISVGSQDANIMASLVSRYPEAGWAQEGGDPCLPASWSWVQCSSEAAPRIFSISLSGKNITGSIPVELTKLSGLVELKLDGNSFTGQIPDFTGCHDLQYIHLEDNQLTGALPPSLGELPNLKELYIQNNKLSGEVPQALFKKSIIFNFSGNSDLRMGHSNTGRTIVIIVCAVVGAILILVAAIVCYLFTCKRKKKSSDETVVIAAPAKKLGSFFSEVATESAHRFALSEIEDATDKFDRRIGSGGFGIVYYGKLTDGREIAVKLLTNDSYQGIREFLNEVTLLSRIHHRNLVSFLGYSQQDGKNILVYEFMHNGTLKEHLRGGPDDVKITSWVKRLEIAEDAAKGIEYLHTGCSPTIIHRDLKSSNILLDKNMRAKVADFGLSKPVVDGSHVSSIVRGTVGYLDPEYYISQQLTEKSDMYSFGVILLELISGHEPISNDNFGLHCRNIVEWARSHMESGDIHGIIDQSLDAGYDLQSVWKIAEVATMCVKPKGVLRPSISEVLKEIQDAIAIELQRELPSSIHHLMSKTSPSEAVNTTGSVQDLEQNASFDELLMRPGLR
ncbi:probable LRR receptor-like serine/threonine-protein kinase At1g67720 [Oryza glaberrima]|uniref:probable LRR receptor-like serine/threonine-protein kinase At1g67720 n=1 Tax=Oryza glaberrima TaxID=4538 RepID=UPI00224C1BD1|nr:probable LRR receptor-like serine/threonine-protein kinase At1g67720 [Oryza glaberrima]XP_052136509.1 probable LRR receptor-like serine/threonine-protein kinase At1g67720 [Oryza glaberrima]